MQTASGRSPAATAPQRELLLAARDLVVRRGAIVVLNGLEFELRDEAVAIQGPSGCGKSTLLAVLCGLLQPDSGVVSLAGTRLDHASDKVRSRTRLRSMGLVFQGDEFIPELTIEENVTLPLRLTRTTSRRADYRPVLDRLLDRLGIGELGPRMPSEVSGGQLQRAAVARAVIHRPQVILADEPTDSLDEQSARAAMTLLIELARENTSAVVVVTHDDAVAAACDRTLRLSEGRLTPPSDGGQAEHLV